MKPTYEQLVQTLDGLAADVESVYKALADGRKPIISIGQFRRLETVKDTVMKAKADIA
ncbi:MAG TPA: hypothetical protein VFE62_01425 [Gemmataceae bacterium]|nr:hypothetical protein [Gemmataceae bacterium]